MPSFTALAVLFPDCQKRNYVKQQNVALLLIIYLRLMISTFSSLFAVIDLSFVEKTSQMSLAHKIPNVPNSQNTFKTQFSLKRMIGYSLAFSFECQKENMKTPSC